MMMVIVIITIIATNVESPVCLVMSHFFTRVILFHSPLEETEAQRGEIIYLLWNMYQVVELGL